MDQNDLSLPAEQFSDSDEEIMATEMHEQEENPTSIAKNKLKEIDDILNDYAGFDEIQLKNDDDLTSEVKGDATSPTSNLSDDESFQEANENFDTTEVTQEKSTVQQEECEIQNEVTDQQSDASSVITFPNKETCDLSNPDDREKLMRLCKDFVVSFMDLKTTLAKKDAEVQQKEQRIGKMNEHITVLEDKNDDLNTKFQGLVQEVAKSQETLKTHDASARAAIARLQKESDTHIKTLKGQCAAMQKDKETAVMNFARREKELIDAKRLAEVADKKSKEAIKEKEKAIVQMKGMKMDMVKMKSALEHQEALNGKILKDVEKWKEEANSHVIKVKWAQNKLKSETDLHNETKEKLTKALQEIKRVKEEAEQIRRNCQGMIKTYQESEEMRSNSLDSKLKEKEMLLSQQEAKSGELKGIHKQQMEELRRLKQQHKDVMAENSVVKIRVECLEKERLKNEETLKGYTEVLNRQKKEAASLMEKLKELDEVKLLLEEKNEEIKSVQESLDNEKDTSDDMRVNEQAWKAKQQELLEFTQKVSTKNAELASGNEILSSKLEKTSKELESVKKLSTERETELESLKVSLRTQNQTAKDTTSELSKRLEDKEATVNHLSIQLDEVKDEIRTLKRKHNSSIKDLTRQLHQARKRLEPYESAAFPTGSGPTTEDGSMGSRASSDTSLDCVGRNSNASNGGNSFTHNSAAESGNMAMHSNGTDVPETVVASTGEISTQALIERIVRLQRIHAKKNEKIDFLHDHVQQLVDEMQKKNKIIQHYILREESGLLMPEAALNHVTAAERAGGKMSRHLSEEVNRKMQSVLEDTLLKNIALKESIEALGSEIARISKGKT